jgi:hypothetical protein
MLFGYTLEETVKSLSKVRPFVLENEGFQRQLVELETMLMREPHNKKIKIVEDQEIFTFATPEEKLSKPSSALDLQLGVAEIELLIPGLCTMDVKIPKESSIATVKERLVEHANEFFLSFSESPAKVAMSWVVLAMFGYDDMYDFPLENEAIELSVQLDLMQRLFGLEVFTPENSTEQHVRWTSKCRFALVIFSVHKKHSDGETYEQPWTFVHEERPGAPATFLEYNLLTTHLRAWDFGRSFDFLFGNWTMHCMSFILRMSIIFFSYG